ncbi:type IV toxin-antitoxin system AbiEi family antitoxin [Massilia sp. SM-13]|uniref:type IV toxin-antitoxin system AbiEi family antitoxin n=1 Tax=Pseudoduganella rhizocola TaxID=3382643 RepID=UPI0038B699A8
MHALGGDDACDSLGSEAIQALERKTGIRGNFYWGVSQDRAGYRPDAELELTIEGRTHHYFVECKSYIDRKAQLEQVHRQFAASDGQSLLLAPYLSRELAEHCQHLGLQFLDTHGNAYLRGDGFFILITGEKSDSGKAPVRAPKGTTSATSLRVAFILLCKPEMAGATYQEIADAAGVSMGTAHNVFQSLVQRGYLIKRSQTGRRLIEARRLLDEWILNYPSVLRPTLHRRRFSATDPDWWKGADLDEAHAVWGGEVAAFRMTKYLKPVTQTVYIDPGTMDESLKKLVHQHRLKADPNGPIEVLEKFWNIELRHAKNVAPPILVYSELLALLDPRADEVAKMLKEKWIDPAFD